MTIQAIGSIVKTTNFSEIQKVTTQQDSSFGDLLNDLIQNVNETDAVTQQDIFNIASGQADDLHTITINAEKAQLALELMTQVRNKALDAYNEIMKITV